MVQHRAVTATTTREHTAMDLILWRHAEALDAAEGMADADRPLTAKGVKQANRMAQWLNAQLPESTRVLVSPTLRTQQTASALDRKLRTIAELGTEGSVDELLMAARWPDARGPVLVVGHQPTLGMTAAYLLSGQAQPWAVRKGAIWWLRQRQREGRDEVVLQVMMSADRMT
jgi:phosphohistidine phosphatase